MIIGAYHQPQYIELGDELRECYNSHSLVHRKRVLNLDGAHNQPFVHVFAHEASSLASSRLK